MERHCGNCGNLIKDDSLTTCPRCGAHLEKYQYCKHCGALVEGNKKYCPKCGKPVEHKKADDSPLSVAAVLIFFCITGIGSCLGLGGKKDDAAAVSKTPSAVSQTSNADSSKAQTNGTQSGSVTMSPQVEKSMTSTSEKTSSSQNGLKEPAESYFPLAFQTYEEWITKKQYKRAWNHMTPYMQAAMGDYDSWVQGYAKTVSSVPEKISLIGANDDNTEAMVSFRLRATDRIGNQNQTKYFEGTCRIIRDGSDWLIDEISAQQV